MWGIETSEGWQTYAIAVALSAIATALPASRRLRGLLALQTWQLGDMAVTYLIVVAPAVGHDGDKTEGEELWEVAN